MVTLSPTLSLPLALLNTLRPGQKKLFDIAHSSRPIIFFFFLSLSSHSDFDPLSYPPPTSLSTQSPLLHRHTRTHHVSIHAQDLLFLYLSSLCFSQGQEQRKRTNNNDSERQEPFPSLCKTYLHSQRATRLCSSNIIFFRNDRFISYQQPTNRNKWLIDPRNANLQRNNTPTTRPFYTTHSDSTANFIPPRMVHFSSSFYAPVAFLSILVCAQCGGTTILITFLFFLCNYDKRLHFRSTHNAQLSFVILHTKKSFDPHPGAPLSHTTTIFPILSTFLTN